MILILEMQKSHKFLTPATVRPWAQTFAQLSNG